jgi:hypothetical protein
MAARAHKLSVNRVGLGLRDRFRVTALLKQVFASLEKTAEQALLKPS